MAEKPKTSEAYSHSSFLKPLEDLLSLDSPHIPGLKANNDFFIQCLYMPCYFYFILGLTYGGMKPHSKADHIKDADTLIVKNSKGIHFVDMKTGQTDSKIFLLAKNSVFVDLEKDGNVVKVSVDPNTCRLNVANYEPFAKHRFSGNIFLS